MSALALPARAKLNLWLRVLGRRQDGQHEVETLIQEIDLHDLLLAERADRTELSVGGLAVPTGPDNLVLKAAAALEEVAGRPLRTRLRLLKRIPAGSGLGGGSSDAAATLVALSRLHQVDVDLEPIAASLGADVPFFLTGGAAEARGRGEHLLPVPSGRYWFAIAWPGFAVSTAAVYDAWDRVGGAADNHLWEAANAVEPRLGRFRDQLAAGWRLTGSGSAFFLACSDRATAQAALQDLECWRTVARAVGP